MKRKAIMLWSGGELLQGFVLQPETIVEMKSLERDASARRMALWEVSPYAIRRSLAHIGLESEAQVKAYCALQLPVWS